MRSGEGQGREQRITVYDRMNVGKRATAISLALVFSLLVIGNVAAAQNYLEKLSVPLPMDGTVIRTPGPLAPYITYRIKLSSPSNLAHIYREMPEGYISYIVIDGNLQKSVIFTEESDGFVTDLEFVYRGQGKPIEIGLSENRSKLIESVQVEMFVETWMQRLWREQVRGIWKEYSTLLTLIGMLLPIAAVLLYLYFQRTDRLRAEEEKAEAARRVFLLESHNKRIEVMREIDQRANQRAREIAAKEFNELQKKVMHWKTRAYTESYFLNHDLRHQYAYANREQIINELEKVWAKECLEIAEDLPLLNALREQEPGVMHWIQARQEVVHIAHNMSWKEQKVIDAWFEDVPETEIITADEFEEKVEEPVRVERSSVRIVNF